MYRLAFVLPLLLIEGCNRQPEAPAGNSIDINSAAVEARDDIANYAAANAGAGDEKAAIHSEEGVDVATPAAPGTRNGLPDDRTPVSEAPFTKDSAQGAANVVQTYYALIEAGKYHDAWALWDHEGKDSGQGADAFAAGFAKYAEYHAQIGAPGRIDAGAGQRYVTVPVQVYGRLKSGAKFATAGQATLHRVGEIDGATAEQKSWHLHSIDLKDDPAKANAADPAIPAIATAHYHCIDGSRFAARFDNRADTVTFTLDGKPRVLAGQPHADGIWYKADGYELRGKGRAATLTGPSGPPLACTSA